MSVRTLSGDEFEEKMKGVDEYVDLIVSRLELSRPESLMFFSMATSVTAYYAGYVLDDMKEMVQHLLNFSFFFDRNEQYGEMRVADISQDRRFELFDLSQDLMKHVYDKLSNGEPKSREESVKIYMDALWEIAFMPVSISRRTSNPEEASDIMMNYLNEIWDFIENECTVVSIPESESE